VVFSILTSIKEMADGIGNFLVGLFIFAVVIFIVVYIGGGLLGIINFGWKQL